MVTDLTWYFGDDGLFLPLLSGGAVGIIWVVAHAAAGPMREFVQRHYPAVLRTCPKLSIFAVSAVQEYRDQRGVRRPKPDSLPVNLGKPLLYCLEQLRKRETEKQRQEREHAVQEAELALVRQEEERIRALNRRAAFIVAAILIVGMCVCALIWFLAD